MSNWDISRRRFTKLGFASVAAGAVSPLFPTAVTGSGKEPELTEDGLHYQPWFLESFLELEDDLRTAAEADRHYAVMWELKGCPYCEETHLVNFENEKIRAYIQSNFDVLQLNIIGSRLVTDFDGEELSEKKLAAKYGVRFTPTIQFFPKSTIGLREKKPKMREVARLPGYMQPDHFLMMFQYVGSEFYKKGSFREYLKIPQS